MTTIRHYRGDTAAYSFAHGLTQGDITKVSLFVRDRIDGTLRLATNSTDHASAWVIGASEVTLTLDHPDNPAAATTTGIALSRLETDFVYDVQIETADVVLTPAFGAFTLIGDVVTPVTDEDLPALVSTDILDALEAAGTPAADNAFITESVLALLALDTLADVNASAPTDGQILTWDEGTGRWIAGDEGTVDLSDYYTEAETNALIAGFITQAQGDARYGQLAAANTWALAQTFGGQVLAANGAVGAPSYSFADDPNTGIYNGAADQLYLTTGGVVRMRVANAGTFLTTPLTIAYSDSATNTQTLIEQIDHNSGGTPAVNYGSARLWRLKSSTTADQSAIQEAVYWATATHAGRTSAWEIQGVYNATALATWLRAQRTGVAESTGLWLFREATGALEQVLEGAADSGGAGRKALTVAN